FRLPIEYCPSSSTWHANIRRPPLLLHFHHRDCKRIRDFWVPDIRHQQKVLARVIGESVRADTHANFCQPLFIIGRKYSDRVFSFSLEHPVWFPLAHHLLTIGIESVIDHPLGRILFLVVPEAQMPKAFSNSFKSGTFGLIPKRIVGISSINNFAEQYQRRIA